MPLRRHAVPRLGHRWKALSAARKADYGELVASYLHMVDDEIRQARRQAAGG